MKTYLAIFLFLALSLKAQPPEKFFNRYGGNGEDVGYSGKQLLDGQYIVVGSTSSFNAGNTDVYLLKIDSMGQTLWERSLGGFGNDVGKAVIQLPDSGFVITGFTNSFGNGGYDAYILRTDKKGIMLWEKTFGGSNWDFANDLVLASDGNIVVVGYTTSFGSGKQDGFILKYDLSGNLIWQKLIGGAENEDLRSVIKTNDNYLACVGYTESGSDIDGDMYFMKFDLNGDSLFTRRIGGPYKDYANDLVQKSSNEYVIAGAKTFTVNDKTHSYMYSITAAGTFTWENTYYSSVGDESITAVSNSNQLPDLSAYLRNVPVPGFKMQGNILVGLFGGWSYLVNSYGGTEDETFYSMEPTRDGGYLSVGKTLSFDSQNTDLIFVKLDSTVINYSSIVSVKENKNITRPRIRYQGGSLLSINYKEATRPETIQLLDLNGKLLANYKAEEQETQIDLSAFADRIYILRSMFKDGTIINDKVISK